MTGRRRTSRATSSYFGARPRPNGTSWYSYDLGAWHVIVLDSNCTQRRRLWPGFRPGSLAGGGPRRRRRRVCTHGDLASPAVQLRRARQRRLGVAVLAMRSTRAGADVVVNGHDHDYERFAPQDPAGREDKAPWHARVRGRDRRRGAARLPDDRWPTARCASAGSHGVIRFVLHPSSYDWSLHPDLRRGAGHGERGLPLRYRGRP